MKRRMAIVLFEIVAYAAALGCVITRSVPYETEARAPVAENRPLEIVESANVSRPFKVIGTVQVNAGKFHSTKATIEHLKAEARRLGADALMDLEGPGGGRVTPHLRVVWSAKAIVWLKEPAESPQRNE